LMLVGNADVASLVIKAESNYDGLTEEEELRFSAYAIEYFTYYEAAYLYHQQGLLAADVWESIDRAVRAFLGAEHSGVYRQLWQEGREIFTSDFAAYIDGIIEQGG